MYDCLRQQSHCKDAEFLSCRSAQDTLDWIYHDPVLFALTFVDQFAAAWGRVMYKTWACFTGGDFSTQGKQAYNDHYARVRSLVSTNNLLEYHVSQGWTPLCEFLEVEIPKVPFPSGNEPDSFRTQMRAFEKSRAMAVLTNSTPWLLLVVALATYAYARH